MGTTILTGLFGVTGAGMAGYKMNKRVSDLEEFDFEQGPGSTSIFI